jgi:hypothetical protein
MYKISFIMTQPTGKQRVGSWSETWYRDGAASEIVAPINDWIKRRCAMLPSVAGCNGYRVQLVGGRGEITRNYVPGNITTEQDIPQMALNCSCKGSGTQNVKTFQMRGIPDGNVIEGDFQPTAAFNTAFNQFGGQLAGSQFRFKAKDLTKPKVRIVSVTAGGEFTLNGDMDFAVGDFLQVLKCTNTVGDTVKGEFYVQTRTTARTGTFLNWAHGIVTLKGEMRLVAYIYPLVQSGTVKAVYITTRKVGRPFDLYRGRASNR